MSSNQGKRGSNKINLRLATAIIILSISVISVAYVAIQYPGKPALKVVPTETAQPEETPGIFREPLAVSGTDPKAACTQSFCLIAWKDSSSSKIMGTTIDLTGNVLKDKLDFGSFSSGNLVLVAGSSKVLLLHSGNSFSLADPAGNSPIRKIDRDSGTYSISDVAYPPNKNFFSVGSSNTPSTGSGTSINDDGGVGDLDANLIYHRSSSGRGITVAYDKSKNTFITGVYFPGADTVFLGTKNPGQNPGIIGIQDSSYPELFDFSISQISGSIKAFKTSNADLVYTGNGGIAFVDIKNSIIYKIPEIKYYGSGDGSPIYTASSLNKKTLPTGSALSNSPLSADELKNKLVLAYSKDGAGFVSILDSNLGDVKADVSLGPVNSPPSVSNVPFTSTHIVVYSGPSGIGIKIVDLSSTVPVINSPATLIKAIDTETAQYSIIDTNEKTLVTGGAKRFLDTPVIFEHPVLGKRLKATLAFTQGDINLDRLSISADEKVTATNIAGTTGIKDKALLIPNSNNGAGILVCPTLNALPDMYLALKKPKGSACLGEMRFEGPFPQEQDYQGKVAVKIAPQSNPNLAHWSFDQIQGGEVAASTITQGDSQTQSAAASATTAVALLDIPFEQAQISGADLKDASGTIVGKIEKPPVLVDGKIGKALSFDGTGYADIPNIQGISIAASDKTTVDFWMYWEGTANQMPFGFDSYNLYFQDINGAKYFGFNTFNSGDVFGIGDADNVFKNKWVHVTAVFTNGDAKQNELYLNGVKQTLTQLSSTPSARAVTAKARIAGVSNDASYLFKGKIDELKVYKGAVAPAAPPAIAVSSAPPGAVSGATLVDVSSGISVNEKNKAGKALQFNGLDTSVIFTDSEKSGVLDQTGSITVSAWIFQDSKAVSGSASGGYQTILKKLPVSDAGDPPALYDIQFDKDNQNIGCGFSSGFPGSYKQILSDSPVPIKTWTLVTCTWDGTNMRLYINGIPQGAPTPFAGPIGKSNQNLLIGKSQSGNNFAGIIDDVFIYGKALTLQEAGDLYSDYLGKIAKLLNPPPEPLFYEISGLQGSGAILLESSQVSSSATPTTSSQPAIELQEVKALTSVTAGVPSSIQFSQSVADKSGVLKADLTFKSALSNVGLEIKKWGARPSGVNSDPSSNVFKYLELNAQGFTKDDIAKATITFSLKQSELGSTSKDRIKLGRYDAASNSWLTLTTTYKVTSTITPSPSAAATASASASTSPSSSPSASASPSPAPEQIFTFEADTPGFSQFAVFAGPQLASSLSLERTFTTSDNKNVEIAAAYLSGATPITGANCIISKYSDLPLQQNAMVFDASSGKYKYTRTFQTAPTDAIATVICTQSDYIGQTSNIVLGSGQQSSSSSLPASSSSGGSGGGGGGGSSGGGDSGGSGFTGNQPPTGNSPQLPTVILTNPEANKIVGTDATFVCTATGSDIKEISLYTSTARIFKKYKTEPVTSSPATKQFNVQNIPEGTYEWNCEATTKDGKTYKAPENRQFKVKKDGTGGSADCLESKDCESWGPSDCPENGIQTRSCKNVQTCGHPLSRACIYTGPKTSRTPEAEASGGPRVTTQQSKGIDIIPIVLVAVVAIAALGGVLFFLKRKQGGGEGTLFGGKGG